MLKISWGGDLSIIDRAYKFLYVNRTSFNGTGGFSVSNYVKRNMSKSTSDYLSMIDGLRDVHERLSAVVIEHKDIMDILNKYDAENVFLYLDPPYVHSTRKSTARYNQEMTDEQHEAMLEKVISMKSKIMISGYDCELYDKYLQNWEKIKFESPNVFSESTEVIWMNYLPKKTIKRNNLLEFC